MQIALILLQDPKKGTRQRSGYFVEFSDRAHFERAREITKSCTKLQKDEDPDEHISTRIKRHLEAAGYKVGTHEVIGVDEYELTT